MHSDTAFNPLAVQPTSFSTQIIGENQQQEQEPLSTKIDQLQRSHISTGATSPNNPNSTGAGERKVTLGFETQLNQAKSGGRS